MRLIMLISLGAALLSAVLLYGVSDRTRRIAETNQDMEREIRTLKRDIAILRAERAYLMRPERIEPIARRLGMRPIEGSQFASRDDLAAAAQRRR